MLFREWLLGNVIVDGISKIDPRDLYNAWLNDEVYHWQEPTFTRVWMTRQARLILGIKAKPGQTKIYGALLKPADQRIKSSRPVIDKPADKGAELI